MRVNVVLGRFQSPGLTYGHTGLLNFAAHHENPDRFVVMVGVSPVDGFTPENPLSFAQRVQFVKWHTSPDALFLPLFNYPDNREWSVKLDETLYKLFPGATVVLYGGRKSFKPYYTGRFRVEEFEEVPCLSGTDERKSVVESTNMDFIKGQIYALNKQFPTSYQAVDIGLMNAGRVLLIRRADTGVWALPGGFVDPKDSSLEYAAHRELIEETNLSSDLVAAQYVGSFRIPDWRFRFSVHQVMTSLFRFPYLFGNTREFNRDEVADMRFFSFDDAMKTVDSVHLPLVQALASFEARNIQVAPALATEY